MLVVSPHGRPVYWLGDYVSHGFTPDGSPKRLDWGDVFYAPNSLRDPGGRWLMWGWIREARPRDQYAAAGWASCLTLPREISLDDAGELNVKPAEEMKQLRRSMLLDDIVDLGADERTVLAVSGDCLEISLNINQADCRRFGIQFRRTPDGGQFTELRYDYATHTLRLDRERSSATGEVTRDPCECELVLGRGEALKLTIFLDKSVIEIYANGRISMASRIYPNLEQAQGILLYTEGGSASVGATIWQMGSIWSGEN